MEKKNMNTLKPKPHWIKVQRTKCKFPPTQYVCTPPPLFYYYSGSCILTPSLFFFLFHMSHRFSRKKQPNKKSKHVYISMILPRLLLLQSCTPAHSSIPLSDWYHKPTYSKQICMCVLKSWTSQSDFSLFGSFSLKPQNFPRKRFFIFDIFRY